METITLYHYTSKAGAQGIQTSKRISASQQKGGRGDDARFGSGVYLTSIAPDETSRLEIMLNNYDGRPNTMLRRVIKANTPKIQKVVVVTLPKSLVEKVSDERDERDIYLVRGDIDLDLYKFDVVDGPQIDL